MQIGGVDGVVSKLGTWEQQKTNSQESFTDILSQALEAAKETETSVTGENAALLTGETDSIHTPIIESQKAELALSLAIQIRNKVISAYNDIMNMQM